MRCLAIALCLNLGSPAFADPISDCIAENVVASVAFQEFYSAGVEYELTLTNDLSIPIGGLVLGYELWADGRPLPIAYGHWGEFRIIDGGLLSGETTQFDVYVVMAERELKLATEAPELRLELFVENAADIDLRPLGPRKNPFRGWQNEVISPEACQPI
ncbi:hypothetical protein [Cognatishimia sp. MH4019]|uniref:hypothetical protein n=1 Tax=Cognatishimia sp. MH4019 TaxID=2854030 RepID=UPI001CD2F162|nr:hypothetical protein [Cognatishimia sp. MH4019]